jgi:autotransporter-associated beta strand protein
VGEDLGFTSSREVAVAGAGGFRQNGNTQVMYRGGVYGISRDDMTLYLDGDSVKENRIKDISDGTEGGKLSVVKEGAGNWTLEGDLTFTGDISVKGGTLTICKPTRYTWYRWTITSLYPSGNVAKPYTTWKDGAFNQTWIQFQELGLFDSNGINLLDSFEVDNDIVISDKHVGLRKGTAQFQTKPGIIATPLRANLTSKEETREIALTLDRAFDGVYTDFAAWGARYEFSNKLIPVQNNPDSWVSVVMRLRDGGNEVAGLDFANSSGGWSSDWNSSISNFMVEASLDGINWNILTNVEAASVHYDGNMWSCQGGYIDGEETHKVRNPNSFPDGTLHAKWYPLSGRPEVLPSVLDSVGTVSVSGGGVLRLEGDGDVTLSDVCVDAASGGTIDGFSFAESGTLSVVNAPSEGSAELPLNIVGTDGVSKLASWNLSVNGKATTRRKVVVSGNRLTLMSTGFVMVLR